VLHLAIAAARRTAAALPERLREPLRRRTSASAIVLLYHRVLTDPGRDPNLIAVSSERFHEQMAWLARYARVQPEPAFLETLDRRPAARRPSVLITFDDGYADNVRHALPILRELGLGATMFVVSDAVGGERLFWWDALERIVERRATVEGDFVLPNAARIDARREFQAVYSDLHRVLKPADRATRTRMIDALAKQTGSETTAGDRDRAVCASELRAWRAAGMSVGGHTCDHPRLSSLADSDVWRQVHGCKTALERCLGEPVSSFAYPYGGREDFDRRAEQAARAAGYRCAFANWEGNAHWERNRFTLPRSLVRDWGIDEFAERFEGWSACR
jgi:peptidoglycan/xylan/chitin deacetylase (PgdA/CDA1 family)